MKLAFVVPTRNRPQLAMAAVGALLAQWSDAVGIVVSDNSDHPDNVLRAFCGAHEVAYVHPPEVLPMATHWNWAIEQAMSHADVSHMAVHYDRKMIKPGAVARLVAAAARHAETLIAYPVDFVYESSGRFAAWQFPGTGRELEIRTAEVIRASAAGMLWEMGQGWPVLSNCIIPRSLLDRLRRRFGSVCDSTTPDLAFAYRFCALESRYVFLDRACGVLYAFAFSNGLAYFRRDTTGVFGDFVRLWRDRPWLDAAPIPGLDLGLNIAFHEYGLVQRETGEAAFPPVDRAGYLRELARGLEAVSDPGERATLRELLESHGWRPEPAASLLTRIARRLTAPRVGPDPQFATEEEAVRYLLEHERNLAKRNPLLDIFKPVALA